MRHAKSRSSAPANGTPLLGRILWRVSQPMSRIRERKSGGPGSKERIAQGASPLPRFALKTRSHTRSKSSEPIRSTQFSSWLVTTLRESVPANCKIPAAVRSQAWVGPGRSNAGLPAQDHDPSRTSCYFGIGIAHLEEDWGIVWKSHATGMSLTTGQPLFSRGWRYIVASIDNLFGEALGSATHGLGRRGGEERLKFENCPHRAC